MSWTLENYDRLAEKMKANPDDGNGFLLGKHVHVGGIASFELDAVQTDAILELKLYRLARLEILVIQKELKEKRKRAKA